MCLAERERRIAIGAERAIRVVRDAPRPAEYSHVEVEDRARVARGEKDREEGHDAHQGERDPEEHENDVVRDG